MIWSLRVNFWQIRLANNDGRFHHFRLLRPTTLVNRSPWSPYSTEKRGGSVNAEVSTSFYSNSWPRKGWLGTIKYIFSKANAKAFHEINEILWFLQRLCWSSIFDPEIKKIRLLELKFWKFFAVLADTFRKSIFSLTFKQKFWGSWRSKVGTLTFIFIATVSFCQNPSKILKVNLRVLIHSSAIAMRCARVQNKNKNKRSTWFRSFMTH